ncbi:MAG: hypothetical protein NC337_06635 [Roseburia sp.]|nr:hypothetical protein [Roseburia sp.]
MQITNVAAASFFGGVGRTDRNGEAAEPFAVGLPPSMSLAEKSTEGEFLGLTMVPEQGESIVYGMVSKLSEESTADNPVVQIISNLHGEDKVYNVEINKINPSSATQMEMFALCSYADYIGEGTESTFGSYHTLRVLKETADANGITPTVSDGVSAWDEFMNSKKDWALMCMQVCDILKNIPNINARDLFLKGKRLTEFFGKKAV